ncbi:TVP38/TMEM64 family protein [Pseudalkalibacillus caeni]|uniref:TVP38/TMEM64 family membrane protein n=1 Tax=Exobacillus caeni TaxID=2574798 RepID=A0A5R9F2R1_9BACL|nr:TVP38/TMEM64 family protein [Pseudalkalibacillus caeni]TLS37887.1 TVP38/TMEM64 family protein [Pseudalkalibacillus caeni]
MDLEIIKEILTKENILDLLEQYRALGPLPGIFLPMLEALLPILPLFLFVAGNAAAYGFWLGFLFSWIGATLGALLVFLVVRRLAQQRLMKFIARHEKIQKSLNWVERHGFGMVFLLLCFPFTPSAFINVVAGLSRMSVKSFILAVVLGKMVMIAIVSFIGHDFLSLIQKPIELVLIGLAILVLWGGGKYLEVKLNQKHQKMM